MCRKIETDVIRSRESEEKFLIHAYDQMFATINRIHYSIWNMVIVVGGGIGVLNLYTKEFTRRFELGLLGYIIVLAWMLVRLLNFNRWCNRNLFFVDKIETYFLQNDVEKFYGKYRAKNLDDIWKIRTSILLEMIFVGGILFFSDCCYFYNRFYLQAEKLPICCSIIILIAIIFISYSPIILWYILRRATEPSNHKD